MRITDWPAEQRPRERLIRLGPEVLSDAELLAVFLRVGVSGKDAVEMGRDLIKHFGSINRMFSATKAEFCCIHGLGPAKYAQLQAVLELARRALGENLEAGGTLGSPQSVRNYLQLLLRNKAYESFVVLFLDVKNRLIVAEEMFRGTLTHASVHPREVVKEALRRNAAGVILAHNHPSGVAEPSESDHVVTKALHRALRLVEIDLVDHFVVAGSKLYSFAEHGKI